MSEDASESKSWIDRISQVFNSEPQDLDALLEIIRESEKRGLIAGDALSMIEGVLQVAELQVRDIMIPRTKMVAISRDAQLEDIYPQVIDSAHSRFPVIDDETGKVVGILLAKDLLPYAIEEEKPKFDVRDVMRPPTFVPESKRLNVLLREFRGSRNHMAVIVDEYGAVAGLVTIEDVLEQIVGEIEDEHDFEEEAFILKRSETEYNIKAITDIDDFNDYFETQFSDEEVETIGGLVVQKLGHVPERGEKAVLGGFEFEVLRADTRRVHLLRMRILNDPDAELQ